MAKWWLCSLCSQENSPVPERYSGVATGTADIAELKSAVVDYPMVESLDEGSNALVFMFVVDVAGADGAFVDLVKNCLMAALESIPRGSLIGLVTVADTVGVFDLGSPLRAPHVKHVVVPADSTNRTDGLGIEELLPLSRVLVALDESGEEVFLQAIENLHLLLAPQRRGVGTGVRMCVDFFNAYRDLSGVRVGIFLGDRPNWGVGSLSSHRLMDIEPETNFYADEALLAKGVTFDLFCSRCEGETLGLASLKFLPMRTGGMLISNVNPQDLFRLYRTVHAVNCELAIRTSPDVEVGVNYQEGASLATVSSRDSFSYQLEYTSSSGSYSEFVLVQIAFAYSVPGQDGQLRRFLRVITSRAKTSLSWRMVYPSVLPEVQMTLLMHQLVRACFDDGRDEARLMLKRWLSKLQSLCSDNNVSLGVFQNCKNIPRLVFALLNSPILQSVISADDWIVAQVLLTRLPPRDLLTYIYPSLSSWTTPDKMQTKGIHLSHAACAATQCSLFVLDNYRQIIVKGAAPGKDSALRNEVDKIRKLRVTGDVVYDTTGAQFDKQLIEDGQGYRDFVDEQAVLLEKKK